MERLTSHIGKFVGINGCKTLYPNEERKRANMQNAIVRLAAYEDAGMEPEEINELLHQSYGPLHKKPGEWIKAEQEERVLELPCRTGTHVWVISAYGKQYNPPKDGYITKFILHDDELMRLEALIWVDLGDGEKEYGYSAEAFGKIVFLTSEEAETALKDRNEESR